ncbi:MAG: LamG-like jellyroll fold domain-containing protein [Acidimicrobiales bacterium]
MMNVTGTAAPTSASLHALSCAPVELANQSAGSDPMLVRGGVTFGGGGPLPTGSASLQLDGSTALAADVVSTNGGSLLGTTTSEGIWFKTTAGYSGGGVLMGFGSQPSNLVTEANFDRIIWMNASGKLNFEINGTLGSHSNTTSPSSYNDGSWHLVVATVGPGLLVTSTITVYVDGTSVASATGLSLLSGYTGYWHLGWSPINGTSYGTTTPNFFAGQLSDAFSVDSTNITSTQVGALHTASSQATWNSDLTADGVTDSWNLNDSGTTTFAGPYPVIGATSPCTMVSLAVGGSAFCVFSPSSTTTACATPTASSASIASWVAAGTLTFPPTPLATSQTITASVVRGSTYNATYLPGLHLYVPVTLIEGFTVAAHWFTSLTWSSTSQRVTV